MLIDSVPLWYTQTNCYVVAPEAGGPCLVIDAPPDPRGVAELCARRDLAPVALVVTHGHVDHVGGAGAVEEQLRVVTYVHPDDDFLSLHPLRQVIALMGEVLPGEYRPPASRRPLADGDVLALAGLEMAVLHTPGHTPGHCCFHLEEEGILFSGDQLFRDSIGRTDLPGGDYAQEMSSIVDKLLMLPDDTIVLPGHMDQTTLGAERVQNPFILQTLQQRGLQPGERQTPGGLILPN